MLFSSESENEGQSGAETFGVEEETVKKVIELLQTIPIRVRAALAQLRKGAGTVEFKYVVLRVTSLLRRK